MKRIFLMLLGLIVLSSGYGKRVSEQEAYKIASQFMDGKNIKTKPRLVKGEKDSPVFNNYYLYNFENNGGFVIVSGDDRTPSILGYADQGGIDLSNIPANFQWLLDYYDKELSSLASTEKAFPTGFNKVERINKYDIEPLIETQWGQGEPYNLNCPNVQGQRCVTGCVATAMAQVINYHRWPKEQTSGVDGYTTYSHNISMPDLPPMKLDWNNINDLAIARLMLYCGQSVQMDYDPFGSSAVAAFVSEALVNVFGFSKSAIHLKRNDYSDEDWDSLLFDQISDGLPVLYSGQSPTIGGHAFIVDGYEASRYHINWGWDGNCDGYFYLDSLDPFSDSGFTESQEMTINVIPPAGELSDDRPNAIIKYFICEERNIERVDVSSDFKTFSLKASIQNDVNNEISLELGFALYDDNGLVKILENTSHVFSINENYDFDAEIAITADIPQGDYRIISVSRTSDNKEWIANAGSTTTYVKVAVEEKSLHLQPYPLSEFDKNIIDYGTHTIDGITYFLQCEFGNGRAYPLKFEGEGQYKGDIYIPDYVIYQNMRFDIYYYIPYDNGIFDSNDEITSISTPIGLSITNCCNLRSITFRDGSASTGVINNCPLLEKVIFPKNCNYIAPINNCINLRSLSFNTNQRVTIGVCEDGSLWNHQTMPSLSDIYFNGAVPPSIPEWVSLPEPNESLIIHIPNGTFETYKYGGGDWCNWNLQEDLPELPISTKWDYCGEKISEYSGGIVFGCGSNNAETAMRIPSQYITAYKNCQITAIEFYTPGIAFNDDKCGNVEYVFLTTPGIDYIVKEPVVTVRGSWMRVELSTPYTITGDELFVGVGRPHALGAMWTNNEVVDDGFWARNMGPDDNRLLFAPSGVWLKHLGIEDWNHPLPIRAIIEGESLPTDIVIVSAEISSAPQQTMSPEDPSMLCSTPLSPKKEDEKYFISSFNIPNSGTDKTYSDDHKSQLKKVASEQDKMSIKIRNRCPYVVKNITLNWNIDGVAQQPINFQTGLPNNYEEEVIVDMPTDISGRYHSINVSVSAIDGKPDEVSENSEIEEIITSSPSKYFPRKFVLEEATGTWCGYCPLASATIEKTKELYPDNFIPIAIHDDDDMGLKNDSYDSFKESVLAYPNSLLNRTKWFSDWGLINLEYIKDKGEAQIKASASFGKERKVNVSTETEFGFSDTGSDCYRMAYVVLEDNVGPYFQTNYYSNPNSSDNPDDYMNWWVHQGAVVLTTFNDVARGIYDYDGIKGLFPENITEGEIYKSDYTLTLPYGIEDASNLKIATLLIDARSGEILNADCTLISGEVPDLTPKRGDSNGNGEINIADAINIANYVVGKNVKTFVLSASDVNEDGSITISDASATVSIVLDQPAAVSAGGIGNSSNETIEFPEALVVDNYSINSLDNQNLSVAFERSCDYVAIQADITVPAGMMLDDIRPSSGVEASHSFISRRIDENTIRFVIFSFDNKPINLVDNKLLELSVVADEECSGDIRISNVIASDADAHEFILSSKGGHNSIGSGIKDTVGKEEIIKCVNGSISVTNAYGKSVSISSADGRLISSFIPHSDLESIAVAPGIYIVTVGNKTLKVMVK